MNVTKGGVQSVDIGVALLKTLAEMRCEASLNELSEKMLMHPAKVHRYLSSLVASGFISRTAHGRYDLGPYVLEFSTLYLSRLDPAEIATDAMEELRNKTDEGVILSVWGSSGTTVIRWFQSRSPISVSIRPGAHFSTTMSASGRVFMSYLPETMTRSFVEEELETFEKNPHNLAPGSQDDVLRIIDETRNHGMARVREHSVSSVSALAAPVFDYRNELVLTLALFGFTSKFDDSYKGRNAKLLAKTADKISRKLGFIQSDDS